jgi:hypothetical protein
MTIIGVAGQARRRARRSALQDEAAQGITSGEARLLMLRPARASVVALPEGAPGVPPRARGADARSPARAGRSMKTYGFVAFGLVVVAVFGGGLYVIDRGGSAAPLRSEISPSLTATKASGSGRVPVAVTPGELTVRVSVNAAGGTGAWFWCLESSFSLPWEQHLCRSAGVSDQASGAIVSAGVVHLDAASVRGADFFVQMYCRYACDWQAEVDPGSRRVDQ